MSLIRPKAYSYVRMSRDTQLKGDSLRRQREASQTYADRHGLDLVDDFGMEDLGVSGWRGENLQSGNLGRFLNAVKSGEVKKGSYLLVEAFDRISRLPPVQALQPVLDLVNNGITVVTLDDERQFSSDNFDFLGLIISITKMSRAHEESDRKSDRVGKAWANKRALANDIKLTKRCPTWLEMSDDRKSFRIVEERAAVVRRIYDDAIAGMGAFSIVRRLKAERVPTFGRSEKWGMSTIHKLLNSPAVIGDFQPNRLVNGKRQPVGEVIKNYFPRIIADETFYAARKARENRREGGGGAKGKRFSNLFTKIATCGECGGKMQFENKGVGPKGGTYLVCDNLRSGSDCPTVRWKYKDFEASFLAFVSEIDLGSIQVVDVDGEARAKQEREIAAIEGELSAEEQVRQTAFDLHKTKVSVQFIAAKIEQSEAKTTLLKAELVQKKESLGSQIAAVQNYYENREALLKLIDRIRDHNSNDIFRERSMIAARLRTLIANVDVHAIADTPHFNVRFKNGRERMVFPDPHDPMKFVQQSVGDDNEGVMEYPDGRTDPLMDD